MHTKPITSLIKPMTKATKPITDLSISLILMIKALLGGKQRLNGSVWVSFAEGRAVNQWWARSANGN